MSGLDPLVIVLNLAQGPEPINDGPEPYRFCVLCDGGARSSLGPVVHYGSCAWLQARNLSDELAGGEP
jgi:hypothetical protein